MACRPTSAISTRNSRREKTKDAVKDVLLNEAVSILADDVALKQGKALVAKGPLSSGPVVVMETPGVSLGR